jgi:hypothetical protein
MDFLGRKLIIATKHNKESVIGPLIEQHLGAEWMVDPNFDTDLLGTFSGEIEREDDPLTTLKKKCLLAMEKNNCDLGIASEGSFGPHPTLFFAHADEEWVVFIDKKQDLEIYSRELSTQTNFNAKLFTDFSEFDSFLQKCLFPQHAMIIKNQKDNPTWMEKGIDNYQQLKILAEDSLKKNGAFYLETDMRAMYNPSRMKVIESATQKLITKISSKCPECQTRGFDVTDVIRGLPCEWCSSSTDSVLAHILKCSKCSYQEKVKFPNGKKVEDPMYCSRCNP